MAEGCDLPFRAEYAKSNRSSCKMCKNKIEKGELRMAVMVQSPMFDGKVPHWYHLKCFFGRNRPKAIGDIEHFDQMRWEDQEAITKLLENALAGKGPSGGKSGKGKSDNGTLQKDFRVEYSKSGGAACRVCEVKIGKGVVRIGKKDYESQRAKMYGPYDRWHHLDCFVSKRDELEYFDGGEELAGFKTLSKDDQTLVKSKLKKIKEKRKAQTSTEEPSTKKVKTESGEDDDKTKEQIKKQMKKLYYYRDMLEKELSKGQLQTLLEFNEQEVPTGPDRMLDRLADIMMFGTLEPCSECKGQFVFRSGVGYQCTGNISEWTKCQVKTSEPKRREFKLPKDFVKEFTFCKMYKSKVGQRIIPHHHSTVTPSKSSNGPTSDKLKQPLANLTFVLDGKIDRAKLKATIESLGGKIGSKVTGSTAAVVSTEEAVAAKGRKMMSAKSYQVQVIPEGFFDEVKPAEILAEIQNRSICTWGSDPRQRVQSMKEKSSGSNMFIAKDLPKSMKLKLKGGAYVDPESGLDHKAHVLKKSSALYSVVLGAVNIQEGKNSYYKLQLLEHDTKPKWYVFRSWGRVGTTIGGTKLENFTLREDAIRDFESLYVDKTGNEWRNRDQFEKVAGKFFPMDLDLGQDQEDVQKLELSKSHSKLAKPIQALIALIFDIESMRQAMLEFEIDLTKMPLGKLSKKQIMHAYEILTEVKGFCEDNSGSETKFLDASNRFFTLIPHDFGMKSPPILNSHEEVKTKLDMLDNLLEIEIAFNLLQSGASEKDQDPIDAHYAKLHTKLDVLPRDSKEFQILERYALNTHAKTHNTYSLEIVDIFKVKRKGESEKFKKYKDLHNRMLLWHGSRTTNYVGILSQGLRIAPPEAPVTGYMFGKGVYFADMVSKSANYCNTTRTNNTGLLMLCDVALGNMYERTQADYIEKLPDDKHSTKGVGKTEPDPTQFEEIDGAKVPTGKGVPAKSKANTTLLYNEYIVYDTAQCNIKYLFKMKFNYKKY